MEAADDQLPFWYGQNYADAVLGNWDEVAELLEDSDYRKGLIRYPSINDTTYKKIRECYSGLPDYNTQGNADVVCDIRKHDYSRRLTHRHALPILMVDEIGLNLPVISYNRIAGCKNSRAFIWPNNYHVQIAQFGLRDSQPFPTKKSRCIFRGALSGPMKSYYVAPGIFKVSRAEYLLSLPSNETNLDLSFTYIPPHLVADSDFLKIRSRIENMRSKAVPMDELFGYKYVLCLEGSDISSGFGGILASRSVPLHPYPFCYESWFFNGLLPWIHFVPVKQDGSDLLEVLEYCEQHASFMEQISSEGRHFMTIAADPLRISAIKASFVRLWNLRAY